MDARVNDPDYWFLCPEEIGPRPPGAPAGEALLNATEGNTVVPLVDGEAYFRALHDELTVAVPRGYVHIAGLGLNLDQKLVDVDTEMPDGDARRLLNALMKVRGAHVDNRVRVLLSAHVSASKKLQANRSALERLRATDAIECVLDARHPNLGSAHQKLVVSSLSGQLRAFCGGIDIDDARWDDRLHTARAGREVDDDSPYAGGWHDVHCRIDGPAARDLALTFQQRWNDGRPPLSIDLPCNNGAPFDPGGFSTAGGGPHAVQVLRTYACTASMPRAQGGYPFAPDGELSAYHARVRAIQRAKRLIYIEDQYFYAPQIAQLIVDRLLAERDLHVIVVLPVHLKGENLPKWCHFRRDALVDDVLAQLRAQPGARERIAFYHLVNRAGPDGIKGKQIYIHNKMMIVDDAWVMIGSMNCNQRSASHDAELAVGIVDTTAVDGGDGLARKLRIDLWREHLGLLESASTDELTRLGDPASGFDLWAARADKEPARAIRFRPSAAADVQDPGPLWDRFYDPIGTCDGVLGIPPAAPCPTP